MNKLQVFSRLRDSMRSLTYDGTSQKIFGDTGCYVVSKIPIEQIGQFRNPQCFIEEAGSNPYLQTAGLFEQFIKITIFINHYGDEFFEGVMLGRNKDGTTKAGIGIMELEGEIVNHMYGITALSGSKISFALIKENAPKEVKGNKPAIMKELLFSCLIDYATSTAKGNVNNILRSPGSLYWNPTDLSTEEGYGTHLGHRNKPVMFRSNLEQGIQFLAGDETTGDEFVHAIFTGHNPYVVVTFLEHNSNVIALAFPGMSVSGDVTGYNLITGKDLASDSNIFGRLLFVPDDATNNKILLLQKVVPLVVEDQEISRNGNVEYVVKFQCFRKTSDPDGVYFLGDKDNAVLR